MMDLIGFFMFLCVFLPSFFFGLGNGAYPSIDYERPECRLSYRTASVSAITAPSRSARTSRQQQCAEMKGNRRELRSTPADFAARSIRDRYEKKAKEKQASPSSGSNRNDARFVIVVDVDVVAVVVVVVVVGCRPNGLAAVWFISWVGN